MRKRREMQRKPSLWAEMRWWSKAILGKKESVKVLWAREGDMEWEGSWGKKERLIEEKDDEGWNEEQ